jgi:hypothetical protein
MGLRVQNTTYQPACRQSARMVADSQHVLWFASLLLPTFSLAHLLDPVGCTVATRGALDILTTSGGRLSISVAHL